MTSKTMGALIGVLVRPLCACVLSLTVVGCGQAATSSASSSASVQEANAGGFAASGGESASSSAQETKATSPVELADGTYGVEVETDSSMFRADKCTLTVANGAYTAELVLPGEGYSRLYFGKAEDAATADASKIYDYHLNDENKYTFDIPVAALNEEMAVATYGQRRDTWYDHKITFVAPDAQ